MQSTEQLRPALGRYGSMFVRLWPTLGAWVLFLLHASLYGQWLIDDAGISFAYARNLASGFGLVSQPGVAAVEGFSNPLWTFGLALFESLGLFHPLLTPKLVSASLVLGAFLALQHAMQILAPGRGSVFTFAVLVCCAANPSFVIWTTSGLENPLYVALICFFLLLCLWALEGKARLVLAVTAGTTAALIALTRPDGAVFFWVFPLAAVLEADRQGRSRLRQLGAFFLPLAAVAGGYMAFRLFYFGDWLPNTYYAKPGSGTSRLLDEGLLGVLRSLIDLLDNSAFPEGAGFALVALVGFPLVVLARSLLAEKKPLIVVYFFLAAGFIAYLVLPPDWMGEYRFASPLFPLLYVFVFSFVASLVPVWFPKPIVAAGIVPTSVVALFLVTSSGDFFFRAQRFSEVPTAPLEKVATQSADRYNAYADLLGLGEASLAAPDIGGALMYSRLRIVDLAGLCDHRIGRLIHRDKANLRAHVLQEVKPTFIHIHGPWARAFDFYADPRFSEDYLAIEESIDPVKSVVPQILAGSYVRKDVVGSAARERLQQLSRLKISSDRTPYPRKKLFSQGVL